MFDNGERTTESPVPPAAPLAPVAAPVPPAVPGAAGAVLGTATLAGWVAALAGCDRAVDDAVRVEQLGLLEALKSAAAAAQAVVAVDFAASQRAAQRAAGVPAEELGAGIAAQGSLARRESPFRGSRLLGLARALVEEMPHTMAALRAGQISEWRATIIARETACLTRADRARVDAELGPRLPGLGDRQTESAARAAAYRLDPYAFTTRGKKAAADRGVSLRPAPDTMTRLTGFLPIPQGVAAHTALARHAASLRAAGDPRSRAQIMADTMVERLTGQATAGATPVGVNLVITEAALFGEPADPAPAPPTRPRDPAQPAESDRAGEPAAEAGEPAAEAPHDLDAEGDDDLDGEEEGARFGDPFEEEEEEGERAGGRACDEPAYLLGHGPIPAPAARELIERADAQVWLRRLLRHPESGALVAMESRRRIFPAGLRRFLVLRDQVCRTPWCGAPIRHADHVVPAQAGGATSAAGGQGLCEACNYAKQAPGWRSRPGPGGAGHSVTITTPTGHTYTSHPPPPPGAPPTPAGRPPPPAGAPPSDSCERAAS